MVSKLLEDLFSTLKSEKRQSSIKPEKLSKNYFKKISEEIRKIKKQIEKSDPNSEETQKLKENLDRIKFLLRELMLIRLQKIINCVILQNRENLSILSEDELEDEEKPIYKIINHSVSVYIKEFINKLLEGEQPNEEALSELFSEKILIKRKPKDKRIVIITTKFLPKILAPGGKTYGPFHLNDVVILPSSIAEKLTGSKQKVAEEI